MFFDRSDAGYTSDMLRGLYVHTKIAAVQRRHASNASKSPKSAVSRGIRGEGALAAERRKNEEGRSRGLYPS